MQLGTKRKLFNDPVYGFISFPFDILYELIEHPYFQRLRRIKQLGLTHYVYPGALHTRFHHALGALHLMVSAVRSLRDKGVEISDNEAEAVSIAILLHDIGHGPFSHTLENSILDLHHERLSLMFMEELNDIFDGKLSLAIAIFKNDYHRKFFYQLVSGQLDMDRLDYLNRDSFYTGVAEGVIGYDRIIKMLNVVDDVLVVEEKGIYSVEKFLISRRLMYWQVYLHKTAIAAEQMLKQILKRLKYLTLQGEKFQISEYLVPFITEKSEKDILENNNKHILLSYSKLDDSDIIYTLKKLTESKDIVLKTLSDGIINRNLFKISIFKEPILRDLMTKKRQSIVAAFGVSEEQASELLLEGSESNAAYSVKGQEIIILQKDGRIQPLSKVLDNKVESRLIIKHFLCYPNI